MSSSRAWAIAVAGATALFLSCASLHRPKGRHSPPLQRVGGLVVADVNGDGIADLIAGLPGSSEYRHEVRGRIAVWFGGHDGLRAHRAATFLEPTIGQGSHLGSFGHAVVAVGDVNHDGFADVVVGVIEVPVVPLRLMSLSLSVIRRARRRVRRQG